MKTTKICSAPWLVAATLVFCAIQSISALAQDTPSGAIPSSTKSASDKEEKSETDVLQRHYPFYLAYGHEETKLQLSFKTPLVRSWPLYFGYTQLVFWALNEDSRPIRDLTFSPELFIRQTPSGKGWLRSIDYGLLNHNSNGKSTDDSRIQGQRSETGIAGWPFV